MSNGKQVDTSMELLSAKGAVVSGIRRIRPEVMARLRSNLLLGLCGLFIVIMIFAAMFAPLMAPSNPYRQNIRQRLLPPVWEPGGSSEHILGSDGLGRDVLSRLIFGARVSLTVGLGATLLASLLGTVIGLAAGFLGGLVDQVLMRLTDIQLGFPFFLFTIVLLTVFEPSVSNIILVLGISLWVVYARVVRAMVLSLRSQEFILAGRMLGATNVRIIFKYLLPLVSRQVTVLASLQFADVILIEGSLSFLGIGIQPPTPSWGTMLLEGRPYFPIQGSLAILPGLAIVFTVFAVANIADRLRQVFGL